MAEGQSTAVGATRQTQGSLWTAADDAEIRRLYPTHTFKQMAVATGRSVNSIRHRCSHLSLKSKIRSWTPAETELLTRRYTQSASFALGLESIAAEMGI